MKSIVKISALLCCIALMSTQSGFAQKTITINVDKGGKLKKEIKNTKVNPANITHLKISGMMNDKDMLFLNELQNLKNLDLENVTGQFYTFPTLPNLTELYLPKNLPLNRNTKTAIGLCSNIELLSFCKDGASRFPIFPKLKKAICTSLIEGDEYYDFRGQEVDTLIIIPEISYEEFYKRANIKGRIVKAKNNTYLTVAPKCNEDLDGIDKLIVLGSEKNESFSGELKIKPKLKSISSNAFYHSNVTNIIAEESDTTLIIGDGTEVFSFNKNLSHINFKRPVVLGMRSFMCSNAKTVHFEKVAELYSGAFDNCEFDSVIFDKNVTIHEYLPRAKCLIFKKVPTIINEKFNANYIESITVPEEAVDLFVKAGIPRKKIIGVSNKPKLSFNITLDSPNSILSKISLNDLNRIDSLTIKGVMYETDLDVLKKCTQLTYLDLSQAYTMYSPEKLHQTEDNRKAVNAMFGMLSDALDIQHKNGEVSSINYIHAKVLAELGKEKSEIQESEDFCLIPEGSFCNMLQLQTVKLPYRASNIKYGSFKNCPNLRNVELPPHLKSIENNCFNNCRNLSQINFPASLNFLGREVFKGCSSLSKIDLSKCSFKSEEWRNTFDGCDKMTELYLPNGIKIIKYGDRIKGLHVFIPSCVERLEYTYSQMNLHFKSAKVPVVLYNYTQARPRNCTVYIPKGSMTSYYSAFGDDNEYIEE